MAQKTTLGAFNAIWPKLRAALLEEAEEELSPEELEAYSTNLQHNPLGGKCNRGMSVPDSLSILLGAPLSKDDFFQAATLGWMTELFQAASLVADDMTDQSITRRGQPCWYKQPGVGLLAIRDAFMMEIAIFTLLERFFSSHPAYVEMTELFQETICQTEVGQLCDLLTAPEGQNNLHNFSMEKYRFIVAYKTSYYSFYLPVALALHMCNLATPKNLSQAEKILIQMGEYFQIQDDYLDNFAPPKSLGKVGTDIVDNKCSWLVNQALLVATPGQRQILSENYGRKNKFKEAIIKRLYDDMELEQRFRDYEESRVLEIREMIKSVDESEGLKKEVFEVFLAKIYRRQK
ncbi:farnesyl pyrophosphate synthetase [Stachybotrys elegans]|uniref:Farnesyl pyrophosphate synthetase n=1 Tax=Stachybotrys elegans TaxID=80388 RepID=A0A8K0SYF3_9HYPO|nr:farnesyl pyrophosphate synthetase [Stachybotrys elegans]